jgi:hypothetical protein
MTKVWPPKLPSLQDYSYQTKNLLKINSLLINDASATVCLKVHIIKLTLETQGTLEHKWNLDMEESHAPTQQQIKYLRVIKKKKRPQALKIDEETIGVMTESKGTGREK